MDIPVAPAEVAIDDALVRALLTEQHPTLAGLSLRLVGEGWDNVTYRLGDELAIRLPRRAAAVELLLNERRWLPVLGRRVGLEVPMPVADGEPSAAYPWAWSVVRWVEGDADGAASLGVRDAPRLAAALRALHVDAPLDAPANPFRGVPLSTRADAVEERLTRLGLSDLVTPWHVALAATGSIERRWLHGDLHARNVVLRGGRLAGLIDWGDLCAGDTASDLACAWMLLDSADARAVFWEAYGAHPATRARARGWAVHYAAGLLDSGEPGHEQMGGAIARRIMADRG